MSITSVKSTCRLCRSEDEPIFVKGPDARHYYFCAQCHMVHVREEDLPDQQTERNRYLTHQNGIQFEGYVNFLKRAIDPALEFIPKEWTGLDYGCGPAPTLSKLLKREGYTCEDYDPFFVVHALDKKFGFIFATEVFEHFFDPFKEIKRIESLLDEGGILAIMTERWQDTRQFADWCYARDNSHVCFYHTRTFAYICETFGFKTLYDDGQRVIILRKEGS